MRTPRARAPRGFTLIEMIITLSVFLLLTGAVFGIFNATLQGVSSLQNDQAHADRSGAFHAWLAKSFLALPADGTLLSYRREGMPFDASDVIWDGGDHFNALDLHLQPDGLYTLRLAVRPRPADTTTTSPAAALTDFERAVLQDDAGLSWRPLLHDLSSADWRFCSQPNGPWTDSAPGGRQLLVQFSYQVAGTRRMILDDCWIPPLIAPAGMTEPASLTANP